MTNLNNRRNFIRKTTLGGLFVTMFPEIITSAMLPVRKERNVLSKNATVLFQGDSITDYYRNREDNSFNNPKALGLGYAMLTAAFLLNKYASLDLRIYNRGISGNRVDHLSERWDKDCLELKPDVISILIGINDLAHSLNGKYRGNVETYKHNIKDLLGKTKKALPEAKLVIGEPFAIPGIKIVDDKWYPEINYYQRAAYDIAIQFGAVFIPYQRIFDEALKCAPGVCWTEDGIHPTLAGSQLMAEAWISVIR